MQLLSGHLRRILYLNWMISETIREDEETEDEEELLNEIKVKTDEGALNHFAGYAARRVSQYFFNRLKLFGTLDNQ